MAGLVGLAGVGGAARTPASPAAGSLRHAGLVIKHGDGRITYAYVSFSEPAIDGIELLRRSGVPLVTVAFGGLGEGVCSLEGEGCPTGECRARLCHAGADAPYWRYFGRAADGSWRLFGLGASSTRVHDGDVQAWVWTAGEAGLPPLTLADVARLAGAPGGGNAPGAVVKSVGPPGGRLASPAVQRPLAYALAALLLLVLAAGAVAAARRARRPAPGDER